jgi:glyoxylase-like metal-dependent hydrolase (beta-lactamase superfamily II)
VCKTAAAVGLALAALIAPALAQDARGVVDEALAALGASDLTAISVSGVAAEGNFGQSRTISFGLASTSIANFTQTFDFAGARARTTGVTPERAVDRSISPADGWAEQFEIWVTPWGFLRGAAAASPSLRRRRIDDVDYRVITWTPSQTSPAGQPYRVAGYIDPAGLLARVETWVEHPIFGDMHVETRFSEYRNFGGIGAPTRIARRLVGMETFVMAIGSVRANPADLTRLLTSPAPAPAPRAAASAPPFSERLAEGVYRIAGSYAALAVEFRDHAVVVEAGGDEARGLAVIAETKRLFPGKRIRYVVNTHPHFDHAGGLPPFVAEGVTIIADDPSRYFLEQALRSPRTLLGDALARSKRRASVEGVVEKRVLTDGARTLELHHVERLEHSDAMLLAYLPKERILFTADFELPAEGERASPSVETLARNVERLQLDFDRHVAVHAGASDRALTRAGLLALAGLDQ